MKLIRKIYIPVIAIGCLLTSCTKNFEEINTDPNRPKNINPGVMLGQVEYRFINAAVGGARGFTHELMQVDAPRSSPSTGVHRYYISPGAGVWNNFYSCITDIEDIIKISDKLGEKNYKAIAMVYKCWAYSILTDLYGDVPYSEAVKASDGNFLPKFDSQKDIYAQILKDLVTANDLFDETKALTYGGDNIYISSNTQAGSKNVGIGQWKKFCNTLRLRLLLRLSKRQSEIDVNSQITAILADATKYPVFTSNADDGVFKYPNVYPYFNPYFTARQLDWRDGTYYTKFFVDKLNTDGDPRRAVWMLPVTVGGAQIFRGIDSGYPTSLEYVVGQNSSYTDALKTSSLIGVMLTYSEEEFIKAELALKGFNTGKTSKIHYDNGISASMIQWGVTMPAGFLAQPSVVYNTAGTQDAQLQQIILEKYYALIFTDYQTWFEKRRTGYPILPRGTGIPVENLFPSRVPYPTYLQSLNSANLAAAVAVIGKDNSDVKVWWDK